MTIAHPGPAERIPPDVPIVSGSATPGAATTAVHAPGAMTRRTMLVRAAAVTTGVAAAGGLLAACGSGSDAQAGVDTARLLEPLSLAASIDAAAARRLAVRTPERSAALTIVAAERQVHATTINDEIARLAPDVARPSTASGVVDAPADAPAASTPPTSATASDAAADVTTVDALLRRLRDAATATGDLAVTMDGYRAGMLGSVAAALTAEIEVQLA